MQYNDVIDTIVKRRSIRSFTDQAISHEDLETIITCAQCAPSAMNRQAWRFVVVETPEKIASLVDTMRTVLESDSYDMYKPAAVILVGHLKHEPFSREDDACALQTIFLAAQSLGIGSCWINQLHGICDDPRIRAELGWLGLSDDYEVHGMAALGYAAKPAAPRMLKSSVSWA